MKVAVATFGVFISPRFDGCTGLLILNDITGERTRWPISGRYNGDGAIRVELLRREGVRTLLCGGIRRSDYYELGGLGIEVIHHLNGDWSETLARYAKGEIKPEENAPWSGGKNRNRHRGRKRPSKGQGMRKGGTRCRD